MEPSHSQMLGAAEECQSCESGWTMYLGSPTTHDEDGGDGHSVEDEEEDRKGCEEEVGESDDSMASDASSGPSHHRRGNQLVKEDMAAVITREKEIAEKKVGKKEIAFVDDKSKVGDGNVKKKSLLQEKQL
ncbi:protein SOB FIVE-LIKE 3-like [Prosopis cineraria]|uniref:protein SOB FIVE-LIKE 3-like n=1 Tax=Prosopis cineraria TaxID=364024 RepID=UPI00240EED39|nr:protein SOB FIVE-LIKE 3-like [Prosopis cineraria]XP_054807860.1 protein SOB FIVE-LIKE 3-like [Prosopis cineraria]XP_054807861.1 protein SOB FIVE-LIKE 3-like [Prosopis cineraria]XP_054807862.1 protein SOB FIVE-LIKE 3-like [Prosopis cineraria]